MHELFRKFHPENKNSTQKIWKYDHFKEYLLSLGKSYAFIESIKKFPQEIELSDIWHETFNQMRAETLDGKERYIFIATNQDKHSILLPRNSVIGDAAMVHSKSIMEHKIWGMGRNINEMDYIGSIHSHPRGNYFSAGDLHALVYHRYSLIDGLVCESTNSLVFGTKETGNCDFEYLKLDQSPYDFMNYWYYSNGYRVEGEYLLKNDGSPAYWEDVKKIESLIAKRHNLAIYRGEPNQLLKRVYPQI